METINATSDLRKLQIWDQFLLKFACIIRKLEKCYCDLSQTCHLNFPIKTFKKRLFFPWEGGGGGEERICRVENSFSSTSLCLLKYKHYCSLTLVLNPCISDVCFFSLYQVIYHYAIAPTAIFAGSVAGDSPPPA